MGFFGFIDRISISNVGFGVYGDTHGLRKENENEKD